MQSHLILFAGSALCSVLGYAQPIRTDGGRHSNMRIAVPFLLIAPDARAAGMGDAGAATQPGTHAMHWNAAKYAFASRQAGGSLSFTPWLKQLADDISLSHLSGYAKLAAGRPWRLPSATSPSARFASPMRRETNTSNSGRSKPPWTQRTS